MRQASIFHNFSEFGEDFPGRKIAQAISKKSNLGDRS